jgi:NAD(P)-dependent dehydrogenase (short-subunit alcohol dehydrogenase family)
VGTDSRGSRGVSNPRKSGPATCDAEKAKQQFESAIAAGRYGTPEEVTALVAFLASGDARYVNGAVYTVDRGYTAI